MSDVDSSVHSKSSSAPRTFGSRVARLFSSGASKRDEQPTEPARPFDPEEHIVEKREWARRQQASSTPPSSSDPSPRLFEHFCIVGLPPTMNVKAVSADIRTYHTARRAGGAGMEAIVPDTTDEGTKQYGLKGPTYNAEVLVTCPPSRAPLPEDLAAQLPEFCFPHGVRPELLERTPSMSKLNQIVFGHPYQTHPDYSFVFRMAVADPGDPTPRPLYGICCYARELVHRPPALARDAFPGANAPLARYMVVAPRCYCILTRYPFFELHFRVLHTVLGLERLERMSVFAGELALGLVHNAGGARDSTIQAESWDASATTVSGATTTTTTSGSWPGRCSNTKTHPEIIDSDISAAPAGPYRQGSISIDTTTSSSSTVADAEYSSRSNPVLGQEESIGGTAGASGFVTPSAGHTEDDEVVLLEGTVKSPTIQGARRVVTASRGLSEGTDTMESAESLGAESSYSAGETPSNAPLLAQTPCYSSAGVDSASGLLGKGSKRVHRRMTRYHGALSPGAVEPLEVGGVGNAGVLLDRIDKIEQDLLSSVAVIEQDANSDAAALLSSNADDLPSGLLDEPAPLLPLEPQISEISDENYVSAPQSSGPSFRLVGSGSGGAESELGGWVGATDSQGQPVVEGSQSEDPEKTLEGLNASLATLLTLQGTDAMPADDQQQGEGQQEEERSIMNAVEMLQQYLDTQVPCQGEVLEFQPDQGLQPIVFRRPHVSMTIRDLGMKLDAPALPDIDAAMNLSSWTVAALCRSLSLDNILSFITAALLEQQVVLFCPNVGLLSGIALSLIPLLLPFSWQSLLLPVLPASTSRLDLLEAPVPFIVGVLFKTPEVRARCSGLVRVNVYKDKIKNTGSLPTLPQAGALAEALAGPHAVLQRVGRERATDARPVHEVTEEQAEMAQIFLDTLQKYLKGLVADLKGYTITDVSHGTGEQHRVSILLKESFLDSFAPRDRTFMRQFAETQMFSVYCDAVLN